MTLSRRYGTAAAAAPPAGVVMAPTCGSAPVLRSTGPALTPSSRLRTPVAASPDEVWSRFPGGRFRGTTHCARNGEIRRTAVAVGRDVGHSPARKGGSDPRWARRGSAPGAGPVTAVDAAQDVGAMAGGGGAVASHLVRRPHRGRLTGTTQRERHRQRCRVGGDSPINADGALLLHLAVSVFAACAPACKEFHGRAIPPSGAGGRRRGRCGGAVDLHPDRRPPVPARARADRTVTAAPPSSHVVRPGAAGAGPAGASPARVSSLLAHPSPQKSFLRGITTGAIKG
jgi:hypothetical protein